MKAYSCLRRVWLLRVPSTARVTLSILQEHLRGSELQSCCAVRPVGSGLPPWGRWWDSGFRPSGAVGTRDQPALGACNGRVPSGAHLLDRGCWEEGELAARGTHQLPGDKSFHSRASRAGQSPARGFPTPLQPCNYRVLDGKPQGTHLPSWEGGWFWRDAPHLSPGTPAQAAPTARAPAAPPNTAHLQSQEAPLASVPSSFHRGCKSHRSRHSEPGSSAGAPAGSRSFGTAPTAQRDTGLCLTNRWHQRSHSQVWWQRRTCCPAAGLPREWGPVPQPWGGPRGCCLQNAGSKSRLCSRQVWGSRAGSAATKAPRALCAAPCLGSTACHRAAASLFGGFVSPVHGGPAGRRTQVKAKPAAVGQVLMGACGWVWGLQIPGPRQEVIKQVGNQGTSWQGTALGGDEAGAGAH